MIEKKKLVKKLYLDKGLSIAEISDILEETENNIKEIVEKLSEYNISTTVSNYSFRQLKDKDYLDLKERALPIETPYPFVIKAHVYLYFTENIGIPKVYAMLSYFFGEPSKCYDERKSSFAYHFLLKVHPKNSQTIAGQYILTVKDLNETMQLDFLKITEDYKEKDSDKEYEPFPELNKKEIKKIWYWFMAFLINSLDYFNNNKLDIKPFCKKLESNYVVYGYKNEEFFSENYLWSHGRQNYRTIFSENYKKYNKQVRKEVAEMNYRNKSSQLISKIIEETNKESLPIYEYRILDSNIYDTCTSYLSSLDYFNENQIREKAKPLNSMLINYLAFEDEYDSIENFYNNNYYKISGFNNNFALDNFKEIFKMAKDKLEEVGYTDQEINLTLDFYRENFLEGYRSGRIEVIEEHLNKKFKSVPEDYKEKLRNASIDQLNKISSKIFDMEEINEIEECL